MRTGALLLTLCIVGCGPTTPTDRSSGATCPEGSTLTYTTFGQTFFTGYCTKCHSSTVSGANRKSAPVTINFDSLSEIQALKTDIDLTAAKGAKRTNTTMPPEDPRPSEAERAQLGEWLACGAP